MIWFWKLIDALFENDGGVQQDADYRAVGKIGAVVNEVVGGTRLTLPGRMYYGTRRALDELKKETNKRKACQVWHKPSF